MFLKLTFVHYYTKNFHCNAWYTLARCCTSGFRASDEGFASLPIDENQPVSPAVYGPCALSPQQSFMISPVWTIPHGIQLSSITRRSSALRYNITAGEKL